MKETAAGWVGGRRAGALTELQTLGVDLLASDKPVPEGVG